VGVARMVRTDNKFAISYSICIIRPTKGVIPEYVEALMNSDLVQTQAKTATIGIAIPDLGLKEIRSFEVPVPPLREQLQFRSLVDRIKKIVDDQTESTEEINELFYSLMYKAFRGDLV
jgi:type I restriction enzyme S subunit